MAGIARPDTLARGRKYAIVIMFAAGAVLTPPDVVSQVMLAFPLCVLYESGIIISRAVVRRRRRHTSATAVE